MPIKHVHPGVAPVVSEVAGAHGEDGFWLVGHKNIN